MNDTCTSLTRPSLSLAALVLSPDSLYGVGYLQHVVLALGVLSKRVTSSTSTAVGSLLYRKRYFELTNLALTYYPTEKKTGVSSVRASFPRVWERGWTQ